MKKIDADLEKCLHEIKIVRLNPNENLNFYFANSQEKIEK